MFPYFRRFERLHFRRGRNESNFRVTPNFPSTAALDSTAARNPPRLEPEPSCLDAPISILYDFTIPGDNVFPCDLKLFSCLNPKKSKPAVPAASAVTDVLPAEKGHPGTAQAS